MSPAKTDEPIEMPFGLWSRVGPRNHTLGGGPDPQGKRHFRGCFAPLEVHCNKSAENGNILAVQYTYKLYNIHIYRQHLASAIYGCSSFTDAHLHLPEKAVQKDVLCNSRM